MSSVKLEVFDTKIAPNGAQQVLIEATAVDEAKVAGFEQGYTAGWDDATAAQQGDQGRIRSDLARNLQSLSFTFQDARTHVLQAIKPLLLEMINRLLPQVAHEALAPTVLEALMPLVDDLAESPVTLVLNPAVRAQIEDLVTQATGLPLVIEEEDSLPEGQVYIRFGTAETKVDLDRVTSDIAAAVRAFFNLNT